MTEEEFNEEELKRTATIGEIIKYLERNFNPSDKVTYMDCVEGVKNDCTYITKKQLGERFFYYVKQLKEWCKNDRKISDAEINEMYPYVQDGDVVVC